MVGFVGEYIRIQYRISSNKHVRQRIIKMAASYKEEMLLSVSSYDGEIIFHSIQQVIFFLTTFLSLRAGYISVIM